MTDWYFSTVGQQEGSLKGPDAVEYAHRNETAYA